MDTVNQVLGSDDLMIFRNTDWPGNSDSFLNKLRSNSYHSLYWHFTIFTTVVLLCITSVGGKICIEIRIAKTPTVGAKIEPLECGRIRNSLLRRSKGIIEQIYICDMSSG